APMAVALADHVCVPACRAIACRGARHHGLAVPALCPELACPAPVAIYLAHHECRPPAGSYAVFRSGTRQGADLGKGRWRLACAEDPDQAAPPAVLLVGHEGVEVRRCVLVVTAGGAAARCARHRADARVLRVECRQPGHRGGVAPMAVLLSEDECVSTGLVKILSAGCAVATRSA